MPRPRHDQHGTSAPVLTDKIPSSLREDGGDRNDMGRTDMHVCMHAGGGLPTYLPVRACVRLDSAVTGEAKNSLSHFLSLFLPSFPSLSHQPQTRTDGRIDRPSQTRIDKSYGRTDQIDRARTRNRRNGSKRTRFEQPSRALFRRHLTAPKVRAWAPSRASFCPPANTNDLPAHRVAGEPGENYAGRGGG